MRIRYGVGPVLAALLTAGAVTASAAPTLAAGSSPPSAAAVVQLASSPVGRVLVTGSGATSGAGLALYEFSGDAFPAPEPPTALLQFNCTASNTTTRFTSGSGGVACTTAWPPLMATGALVAGRGVSRNGLTVASAGSGFTPGQVEYFGHPLYTFVKDTPGTFNGEDIAAFGGIFWLVSHDGLPNAGTAQVGTEISPSGVALSTTTASGVRTLYMLTFDTAGASFNRPARARDRP